MPTGGAAALGADRGELNGRKMEMTSASQGLFPTVSACDASRKDRGNKHFCWTALRLFRPGRATNISAENQQITGIENQDRRVDKMTSNRRSHRPVNSKLMRLNCCAWPLTSDGEHTIRNGKPKPISIINRGVKEESHLSEGCGSAETGGYVKSHHGENTSSRLVNPNVPSYEVESSGRLGQTRGRPAKADCGFLPVELSNTVPSGTPPERSRMPPIIPLNLTQLATAPTTAATPSTVKRTNSFHKSLKRCAISMPACDITERLFGGGRYDELYSCCLGPRKYLLNEDLTLCGDTMRTGQLREHYLRRNFSSGSLYEYSGVQTIKKVIGRSVSSFVFLSSFTIFNITVTMSLCLVVYGLSPPMLMV